MALLLSLGVVACAHPAPPQGDIGGAIGSAYEISIAYSTSSSSDDGSSSSSSGRNTLVKRIIGQRDGALEVEFDLPESAPPDHRKRAWQYPARILLSPSRPPELLNWPEAEARLHDLLGPDGLQMCGRWFFTWTAVKIDCDARSVIAATAPFIIDAASLYEGAPYTQAGALGSAPLQREAGALVATLQLDGEAMKRQRVEADLAIAEMSGRTPPSIEDATAARAGERISGSIAVRIEIDSAADTLRRTSTTEFVITSADGAVERNTATETTDVRRISP